MYQVPFCPACSACYIRYLCIEKLTVNNMNQKESRRFAGMSNCDKSKLNSVEAKKRRPKWLIPLIALVVVSVLAVASVFAWRAYEHRRHYLALSSCSQAVSNLNSLTRPSRLARYREAEAVQADQVKDVKTINAMSRSVKAAGGLRPQTVQCEASMSTDALNAAAGKAGKESSAYAAVGRDAKAVLASRDAKVLDEAKEALDGKKDDAARLLGDSEGKVADNATRDDLQKAINQADQVKGNEAKAYQDAANALQSAINQVNASVQAKSQAAQQAAAQAAQAQAAQQQPAQQQTAPSYRRGGGYTPAPAPAAPQGGGSGSGSSAANRLPPLDTTHHGCNPDGSCGIG